MPERPFGYIPVEIDSNSVNYASRPMTLDDAIERFRAHLAHERGLSPRTVEAYASDLSALAAFLAKRCGEVRAGWPAGP